MSTAQNDSRKRSKKRYVAGHHSKRWKGSRELEVGMQGILITCNMNERKCTAEAFNLLNEYADKMFGPEKVSVVHMPVLLRVATISVKKTANKTVRVCFYSEKLRIQVIVLERFLLELLDTDFCITASQLTPQSKIGLFITINLFITTFVPLVSLASETLATRRHDHS